jgi:tyrosyl-tRNA synthetase
LRKLKAFQDLGHQIVLIIGDFTATIGDPSDKISKRPMLTKEHIQENMKDYEKQLAKIVDITKAEIHYNSEWLENMTVREMSGLAESFSLQQMIARRNFKDRLDKGEDISMRELLYPLFQGYDSVVVKSDIEIGGFDQLFNVRAGRTVQKHYSQPEQDILTIQMLEGTDGRKMSTSWGNIITIIDEPNDMFGKVMSIKDELIGKYFLLCTDVPVEEIESLETEIKSGDLNPRDVKLRLGREIVSVYHGEEVAKRAEEEFIKIFSQKEIS